MKLSNSFSIHTTFPNTPSDLQDAISQTVSFLKSDKLAPLTIDRGASLSASVSKARQISSLTLSLTKGAKLNSISTEAVKDVTLRDESYTLNVPEDGSAASVTANTTLGLYRALTTFGQLWYTVDDQIFTSEAPISVVDEPAFVSSRSLIYNPCS